MKLVYTIKEVLTSRNLVERIMDDVTPCAFTHYDDAQFLAELAKQPFTTVTPLEVIIDVPEDKVLATLDALGEFSGTFVHVVKACMALAELLKDAGKRLEKRVTAIFE